jgi:hypothetical protein
MAEFNQAIYKSSLDALLTANVPEDIALEASKIVASDDGSKPDFGRTAQDQEVVKKVVEYLNEGWRNELSTD